MWDLARLSTKNRALSGECPSCEGYLHPFCGACFGCGYERGAAFSEIEEQHEIIARAPLAVLRAGTGYLTSSASEQSSASPDADETAVRHNLWLSHRQKVSNRETNPSVNRFPENFWSKYEYLGGLEDHQRPEHALLTWRDGWILIDGQQSHSRIASISPGRVLGVTAHSKTDDIFRGLKVGSISGPVAFFTSVPPTQGGMMKIVFVDDASIQRQVVLGNRTGLTDKRPTYEVYQSSVTMLAFPCQYQAVEQEWRLGPRAYAQSLGFSMPEPTRAVDTADTKICPQCGETIKAAAIMCRFCRYGYEGRADQPGQGNQQHVSSAPDGVSTAPPAWMPTYHIPEAGMAAWSAPDPSLQPTLTLAGGLGVKVAERAGDWTRVVAANGWSGWVDGRGLVPVSLSSAAVAINSPETAMVQFQVAYERIEDLTIDELNRVRSSGAASGAEFATWAARARPQLQGYRETMRACQEWGDMGGLLDQIDAALGAWDAATAALIERHPDGPALLDRAESEWRTVQSLGMRVAGL